MDSFARDVKDAVGAGDALLAYATLAMLATGSLAQACILGSIAAACECEYDGNIPIEPKHVLEKLHQIECLASYEDRVSSISEETTAAPKQRVGAKKPVAA